MSQRRPDRPAPGPQTDRGACGDGGADPGHLKPQVYADRTFARYVVRGLGASACPRASRSDSLEYNRSTFRRRSVANRRLATAGRRRSQIIQLIASVEMRTVNRAASTLLARRKVMPNHRVMAHVLLTAASLTVAGLMLPSAPVRAASAITSCEATESVTPSTFASAVKASGYGCKTLIMEAGSYPKLYITSHSGGVLTLRCQSPGTCRFPGDNRAQGVDGLIIDGIQVTGGSNGLYIHGRNILVQNSTFIEQTSSGVTVIPSATRSDNIQIYNNEFRNAKRGCEYTNPSNCSGQLPDGSPVAEMDYGLRVHDTNYIEVKGNTFGTMFNHAISIKWSVVSSLIQGNTFPGCGRVCIDLGQQTPASIESTITGNTFGSERVSGVTVRYIIRAVITGNTFAKSSGKAISLKAVSLSRVIVQSPNTVY